MGKIFSFTENKECGHKLGNSLNSQHKFPNTCCIINQDGWGFDDVRVARDTETDNWHESFEKYCKVAALEERKYEKTKIATERIYS
jgi:hypothetical protein